MGHGFGELYKLRGIITYRLSPFELRAYAGALNPGFTNTLRRILENVPYMLPRKYQQFLFSPHKLC